MFDGRHNPVPGPGPLETQRLGIKRAKATAHTVLWTVSESGGGDGVNKAIEDAINQQLNAELASAYLYLSMSAHFASEGLPGFAHWMRLQGREELDHALRFFDHLVDRGSRVSLAAIDQPSSDLGSPLSVFEQVLQH
jgi:hypothetical protein